MRFKLYEGRRVVPHTKAEMGVPIKEPGTETEVLPPEPKVEPKFSDSNKISFRIKVSLFQTEKYCYTFYYCDCKWDEKTGNCLISNVKAINKGANVSSGIVADFQPVGLAFTLENITGIVDHKLQFYGDVYNYPDAIFQHKGAVYVIDPTIENSIDQFIGKFKLPDSKSYLGFLPLEFDFADIDNLIKVLVLPRLPDLLLGYKQTYGGN